MAKSALKIKARELRKNGESIKSIAKTLMVSSASASLWCRDIELSEKQIQYLLLRKKNGVRRGQLVAAFNKKNKRLEIIQKYKKQGELVFNKLGKNEFFASGVALYLAEGTKERRVEFTNSDPKMIKFMMIWFSNFFNVSVDDFAPTIFINESHQGRDLLVRKFWSEYLDIPLNQFRKTVFLKSQRKKLYENHDRYFGTFKLRILKSTNLSYRILGLINGLIAGVVQR